MLPSNQCQLISFNHFLKRLKQNSMHTPFLALRSNTVDTCKKNLLKKNTLLIATMRRKYPIHPSHYTLSEDINETRWLQTKTNKTKNNSKLSVLLYCPTTKMVVLGSLACYAAAYFVFFNVIGLTSSNGKLNI